MDKRAHARGQIAEAVDKLVDEVVGLVLGAQKRDAPVDIHALPLGRDVRLGDVGRNGEIGRALGAMLDLDAALLEHGLAQELHVHIVADVGHMPRLLRAEKAARSANFKVAHRDLEARAELGKFADRLEALFRDLGEHLVLAEGEVGRGAARAASDAAAYLVQLSEAEAVGVLDDEGVDIRNVDARLDDRRADEHLNFSVRELLHHGRQALFVHLAVRDADGDIVAEELFELGGAAVDGLDAVVHVVDLPAARELARGGQVYYMHNRVETIDRCAAQLKKLLGDDVAIGVAHGKMDEKGLSSVMQQLSDGEIQVLVCTTIIETGIDIPNVNTLIIEDADRLGLAQLHQIRGRVGRSTRRASAYLTFRQNKVLTEVAEKRLEAIREFAEFGSGFKIAMRDLEIRGAGSLLGAEQSGHMTDVGYDMYMKLLSEAVLEERGVKVEHRAECSADLAVAANIPEAYIPAEGQRMDIYRRIALLRTEDEADDLIDELIDRFGDLPSGVSALIHVALLRGEAGKAGISDISQKSGKLIFALRDFDMERISALYARPEYKGVLKVEAGTAPRVSLRLRSNARIVDQARKFIKDFSEAH